jgi:hypothetical protein
VRELEGWSIRIVVSHAWAYPDDLANEYGLSRGIVDAAHLLDGLVLSVRLNELRLESHAESRSLYRADMPFLTAMPASPDAGFTVFRPQEDKMRNYPTITGRKIRLALVGCGRIAANHFAPMEQHAEDVEIVDVCDVDRSALDKAVQRTLAPKDT